MPLPRGPLPAGVRRLPSGKHEARYAKRSLGVFTEVADAELARKLAEADARAGRKVRRSRSADPSLDVAAGLFLAHEDSRVAAGEIAGATRDKTAQALRPWRADSEWTAQDEDGFPFAESRLSQLETAAIAGWFDSRRSEAPDAARKELFALKAALRRAAIGGAQYEAGILTLSPGRRNRREGRALRPWQLEILADAFPERLHTLPLFVGTVGLRIAEALGLTRDRCDLYEGTIFVPAELCKERRDKTIPLLAEEVELIRLALAGHDSPYVWPRPRGGAWNHWSFWGKVWQPACELAAAAVKATEGTDGFPFRGLRPHDLRYTAATLMRRSGFDADTAALRLGHADGGWLLTTLYNKPDTDELRAVIQAAAGTGIRASLQTPPARGAANVLPLRATGGRRPTTSGAPRSPRRRTKVA